MQAGNASCIFKFGKNWNHLELLFECRDMSVCGINSLLTHLNTCQISWRTKIKWYESCCITLSQQMRVRHNPVWFLKNDPHAQSLSHMKLVARSSSLETLWRKHDESTLTSFRLLFLYTRKCKCNQTQTGSIQRYLKNWVENICAKSDTIGLEEKASLKQYLASCHGLNRFWFEYVRETKRFTVR